MAKKKDTFKVGDADAGAEDELNIALLLDASGSMSTVKTPTISGFNEYVTSMKGDKNSGKHVNFTFVTFNSIACKEIYSDVAIKDVPELTAETYITDGWTPLYDSIAFIIRAMSKRLKDKKNKKALLVIMTDGQENSSKEYNREAIFNLIKEKEAEGWAVSYLGANQDAWQVANLIGVDKSNSMSYSVADMANTFGRVAKASMLYSASSGGQQRNLFVDQDDDKDDLKQ